MLLNKLEPSSKVKGRWLCHLEDGTILRVGDGEVVSFGLHSGMELSDEARVRLEAAAQTAKNKNRALTLLTARPMSRKELIRKLTEKETPGDEAGEIADWLERLGLLNDEAYAHALVRHYAAKGYGPYKLKDELYRRGVPKEYWDAALNEVTENEEQIDAFVRRKLKGKSPDRQELKKVSDALARRGYRWAEISAALRRCGAEIQEESI
ncbi:MAG: regulatory protein RecX [Clostridia bacterium]|nr:regulatory protein RecX [Clostridia bacterium]